MTAIVVKRASQTLFDVVPRASGISKSVSSILVASRSSSSKAKLGNLAKESRVAPTTEPSGEMVDGKAKSVAKPGDVPDPVRQADQKQKTMAQLDQELMQKMAGLAGDGGESGIEYEDGKPVAMKRGVRDNMFRYI